MATPSSTLSLVILVDAAQGNQELKQFNVNLSNVERTAQTAGANAAAGIGRTISSSTEAREAVRGLSETFGKELGVNVPRYIGTFIASSNTIGPALASAFSTVAIVGFAVIAGEALAKIVVGLVNYKQGLLDLKQTVDDVFHPFAAASRDLTNENIDAASKKMGELILASQERQRALKHELSTTGLEGQGQIAAGLKAQIDQIRHEAEKTGTPANETNKEIALATQIAGKKEVESRRNTEQEITQLEQQAIAARLQGRQKALAEVNVGENKELEDARRALDRKAIDQGEYDRKATAIQALGAAKRAEINRQYDEEHERAIDRITEIESAAAAAGLNKHELALQDIQVAEVKQLDQEKKLREAGVIDEAEYQRARVALESEAVGKRKMLEDDFAKRQREVLNSVNDQAAISSLEASDSIVAHNRAKLLQIQNQERDQLQKLKDDYDDGLLNYKQFQDAQTAIAITAANERTQAVKAFGAELEGYYDRDIAHAKSASQALKNIWGEYTSYLKKKAFESLAGAILGPAKGLPTSSSQISFPGAATGNAATSKLEQVNHLGDLQLVTAAGTAGGAIPVVIANAPGFPAPFQQSSSTGLLASGLAGIVESSPSVSRGTAPGIVQSTIDYGEGATDVGTKVYAGSGSGSASSGTGSQSSGTGGFGTVGGGGTANLLGLGAVASVGTAIVGLFSNATGKLHDKIKATYGVDVKDSGLLNQILNTANQSFGGNLDLTIQSPTVRQLIQLYASANNQKGNFPKPLTPTSLGPLGSSPVSLPSTASSVGAAPTASGGGMLGAVAGILGVGGIQTFGSNSISGGPGGTGGFTGPVGGQPGLPSYTSGTAGSGGITGILGSILGGKKGGSSSGGLLSGAAMLAGGSLLTAGMAGNQYGQQTTGSSLETIGGATSLGYGLAPMLGASGLWGATAGLGAGLIINGYQQHSGLGVAESAGGGALLGLQLGGPVGAAIGGIVGLGVGLAGLFTQTASQKAREKIKATYGVDISDQGILQQIVNTAKQSFGGNLDTAIQSQQVRDLIQLYAMSTGQKGNFPRPMTPTSLVESGSSVSQQPTYINGAAISSLGGTLPTVSYPTAPAVSLAQIGASSPGSAPTAISIPITSSLDGKVLADHTVNVIAQNGRVVSAAVVAGQLASSGRRQTAANLLSPRTLLQ